MTTAPAPHPLDELLAASRPLVMGILNVTPDSFSDGGAFLAPEAALAHARAMVEAEVDIIDIGAESTRPYGGMRPIVDQEEIARLEPVFEAVVALGKLVSVDTMKASVAEWAILRGAAIINDVWGLQRDPDMAQVAADNDIAVVVMHNRLEADPAIDIVADIDAFFARSLEIADKAGISPQRIILDPGIGFGKTPAQSVYTLAKLETFRHFGRPLLVGLSRKRFIDWLSPAPPEARLGGSIAGNLVAAAAGAAILRVHDVREMVQALRVAAAIRAAR